MAEADGDISMSGTSSEKDFQEPFSKVPSKAPKGHEITSKTIKSPPNAYVHLELISSSPSSTPISLDLLTAQRHLTSALSQFLGLTGAAIPIDILKLEGCGVWIRCPREDLRTIVAGTGGWLGRENGEEVGWRVRGSGNWLGAMVAGEGSEGVWG